ncbi:glutathione S-transferase family protein (plasmid) [Rhizobium grahamii]|uniref:Glutathione S-transferase family protein n=1 Tax=Rhizobium grahamii TaxID=1120045 RepID=A0A5Q0CDM8_9HYPH|nr:MULTISPECIES: glutathione S-transferase family protein [Rhizobium]QFY62584.1 glutathione S-transferase family protein [Rhizobium grahamii]QRM52674.1 glutathione S-transferase family protein [Rhizobium sp. BG6]
MPEITLYDYELDESGYRARLLLSMLGLTWKTRAVDMFPGQEHKKPALLSLNPLGALPILQDGDLVLYGASAILLYLAKAYDTEKRFLPDDAAGFGAVCKWLGFSDTALAPAIQARLQALFNTAGEEATQRAQARKAFRIMDDHMTARHFDGKEWFVGNAPTLADLSLFPSFALSRDYGIDHDEYPALRRWIRRFRAIEGFNTMPGIPDYH